MADSSSAQDKNLPASERKLRKAAEEGQVARSRDLGHFAAMAGGGALIATCAPMVAAVLRDGLQHALRFDREAALGEHAMGERLAGLAWQWAYVALPFGLVCILLAVGVAAAMGQGLGWTWKPMAPQFSKVNPLSGIGRVFSKQQLIDALKGSLLALVLGCIGAFFLRRHVPSFSGLLAMPVPAAIGEAASQVWGGVGLLLLALALFAAIDVPLQKRLHAQRLRMSHQEVKQEHKELEGNAEVKGKVRARMREMTKRRMLAAVPKADLVVMNPTHYAVALRYDDATMVAPRVVAKGADLLALRIRDLARDHRVPVLEAPVLARALYAHAELDRDIPAALFSAVAQVLAWVYQLRAAMAGRVAMPAELPPLDVPRELDPHHKPAPAADSAYHGDVDAAPDE